MKLRTALAACILLASTACIGGRSSTAVPQANAAPTPGLSLALGSIPKSVEGNVVTLLVHIRGMTIVKADGDTSGKTGHFHVFVDRKPPDVGETIPKQRDILHSADKTIKVWGLAPGKHTFTVVVGDGTHTRIYKQLEDSVTVDVKGPSVKGSAPASIAEGKDLVVELESQGVEIKKADGDRSGKTGHFHVLVDPLTPPQASEVIPAAKDGSVYHTPKSSVTIKGLKKGEHILWIVLGDGTHTAFDVPVMDKLTVTVT